MAHTGKAWDDNYRPLASIRQNKVNGNLFLGYSFGKGVELEKDSEDWEDMMDLLEDLLPEGAQLRPNENDSVATNPGARRPKVRHAAR